MHRQNLRDRFGCIQIQQLQQFGTFGKWRRSADNVFAPSNRSGLAHSADMRRYNILNVHTAIQELADFKVVVFVQRPRLLIVVLFREEPRRPKYERGHASFGLD